MPLYPDGSHGKSDPKPLQRIGDIGIVFLTPRKPNDEARKKLPEPAPPGERILLSDLGQKDGA